jgi:MerR family mercuric resistance operon transcriptional regulator
MSGSTIGKAAEAAGVGVETIRFYERRQLIRQPPKPPHGGYRVYSDDIIRQLRFIRRAQDLGFSLREIRELLSLRTTGDADAADVHEHALEKLRDVDRKIERLQRIRHALSGLLEACPGQGGLRCCSIYEALEGDEGESGDGCPGRLS